MYFQNPIAFTGLISVAVIIAMYLLKQTRKEIIIPSIMLWEKAYVMTLAQKPWQKLRRNLLMALQIMLAILIVLALAGPFFWREASASTKDIILVLDTSIGMRAVDEQPNRFERAKEMMIDVINRASPGTRLAVISASGQANIEANFTDDREYIKAVVKGIKVTNTALAAEKAINLAAALCNQERTSTVYIFSGTGFEINEEGINEQLILVGSEEDNAGILMLSYITEPDRIVALVRAKNYSQKSMSRSVALYADDKLYDVKDIVIEPGSDKDVFFTQIPRDTERLTARLSETDSSSRDYLPEDDIAYEVVRNEISQKSLLVTEGNVFLEKALNLMPSIDLYKTSSTDSQGYYLYIYDGVLPDELPDGHILMINPPEGNVYFETGSDMEIGNIYTERSRFVSFLSDMEFAVSKSKQLTTPGWGERILSADETDLIFAGELEGRKIIVIGFDLHNSDLPLKKEFPIFIYNIIEWLVPGDIVSGTQVQSGTEVTFAPFPNADELRVVSPDNIVSIVAPPFPAAGFTNTDEPGFYIVRQRSGEASVFSTFAVNPDSVDISPQVQPHTAATEPLATSKVPGIETLKNILLIICLLLLIIEWRLYWHMDGSRRRTKV